MAKFSWRFTIHTSIPCLVLSNICKADIMRLGMLSGFFSLYEGPLEGSPHSNIISFFCTVQLTRPKQSQNKRDKIAKRGIWTSGIYSHTGLHKLCHPTIRDGSKWSNFGARGEHGDVFLFSNLGVDVWIKIFIACLFNGSQEKPFPFRHSYLRHFSWRF